MCGLTTKIAGVRWIEMGKKIAFLVGVLGFCPVVRPTIFGDNPLLIAPYDRLPYRAVGLFGPGFDSPLKPGCTGFPIAPTVILTNAHCLYDNEDGRWRSKKFYYPAMAVRDGGRPIGIGRHIVPKEYIAAARLGGQGIVKRYAFDFGAAILEEELDESISTAFSVGYSSIPPTMDDPPLLPYRPLPVPAEEGARPDPAGPLPDIPRESDDYRVVVGYTRLYGEDRSQLLRASFCPIASYWKKDHENMDRFFYGYKCSIASGTSGGPVFYREGDRYKVIGLMRGKDPNNGIGPNQGVYIDREKYLRIQYWIAKLEAQDGKDESADYLTSSD